MEMHIVLEMVISQYRHDYQKLDTIEIKFEMLDFLG